MRTPTRLWPAGMPSIINAREPDGKSFPAQNTYHRDCVHPLLSAVWSVAYNPALDSRLARNPSRYCAMPSIFHPQSSILSAGEPTIPNRTEPSRTIPISGWFQSDHPLHLVVRSPRDHKMCLQTLPPGSIWGTLPRNRSPYWAFRISLQRTTDYRQRTTRRNRSRIYGDPMHRETLAHEPCRSMSPPLTCFAGLLRSPSNHCTSQTLAFEGFHSRKPRSPRSMRRADMLRQNHARLLPPAGPQQPRSGQTAECLF